MNRIEALAAAVREEGADALLLTGEVNLIYVTKTIALEGQCLIFPDGKAIFVTDGRYTETAEQQLIPLGFAVITRPQTTALYEFLQTLLREHGVQKLMYEDDVLTVDEFAVMRELLSISFQPVRARIRKLRANKSEEEIACISRA